MGLIRWMVIKFQGSDGHAIWVVCCFNPWHVGLNEIGWRWTIAWWGSRRQLSCCSDRWLIHLRDVSKLIFRCIHLWMLKWKRQVMGLLLGTNNVSKCLPRWTTGIDGFASHSAKYEQSSSKLWRLCAHILCLSGSTRPNKTLTAISDPNILSTFGYS